MKKSQSDNALTIRQKLMSSISFTQLVDSGIIDADGVIEKIMLTKKVLQLHNYAISEPKTENGYWRTHYYDEQGNRKDIKAPSKEKLVKRLVDIYTGIDKAQRITFGKLFWEWLEYKKTVTNSPNTIKRHVQHYKKYIESSVLNDKPLIDITEIFLEQFCNQLVKDYNLSNKEFGNIKTIISKALTYAVRSGYIKENVTSKIEITVKFRQVVHKSASSQVFNSDEKKLLFDYLDKMYSETSDSVYLAVKLNFYLGLRVGELVALKWSDIEGDKLHVVREEVRNQNNNVYSVEEHTKTHTDRRVFLAPTAIKILDIIRSHCDIGEYIFTRDGERITSRKVAYVLEKFAERHHVDVKSTHKMRKTYASNLSASGVPLDSIRQELGHSNLSTTLRYIYNPLSEQETRNLICNALENKSKEIPSSPVNMGVEVNSETVSPKILKFPQGK